jgi:hypothetical protein
MAPGFPVQRPEDGARRVWRISVIPGALEVVRSWILIATGLRW